MIFLRGKKQWKAYREVSLSLQKHSCQVSEPGAELSQLRRGDLCLEWGE